MDLSFLQVLAVPDSVPCRTVALFRRLFHALPVAMRALLFFGKPPPVQACFEAGLLRYWSGVSVHAYRTAAPESVLLDYASLGTLIREHTASALQGTAGTSDTVGIISGEWGYTTCEQPCSPIWEPQVGGCDPLGVCRPLTSSVQVANISLSARCLLGTSSLLR